MTLLRVVALLLVVPPAFLQAQSPARVDASREEAAASPIRAILREVDEHSRLDANLTHLCDVIGGRPTGSEALKSANAWARDRFREYGLEGARLEPWKIARSWKRGTAVGHIVSPARHRLVVESAGWSTSTKNGPVRGRVVSLDVGDEQIQGAWILAKFPQLFDPRLRHLLASGHAAGVLLDMDRPDGLISMVPGAPDFLPTPGPVAILNADAIKLLGQLRSRGPVEVEIDLRNEFSKGEVEVYHTIAELRGAEKPDELVILGAHLDSWDLGTGATDNGFGSMAVLEAARALKASGVRPRRTIRFILFTGEEHFAAGSSRYVAAHEGELGKISAVLVQDLGAGRVTGIYLEDRGDLVPTMAEIIAPFKAELGLKAPNPKGLENATSDHKPFRERGIPAFFADQAYDPARDLGHTRRDTRDRVDTGDANQSAKFLAAWAYRVADWPELLPGAWGRPSIMSIPVPVKSTPQVGRTPQEPAEVVREGDGPGKG